MQLNRIPKSRILQMLETVWKPSEVDYVFGILQSVWKKYWYYVSQHKIVPLLSNIWGDMVYIVYHILSKYYHPVTLKGIKHMRRCFRTYTWEQFTTITSYSTVLNDNHKKAIAESIQAIYNRESIILSQHINKDIWVKVDMNGLVYKRTIDADIDALLR